MIVSERAILQIKKNSNFLVVLIDIGGCKGFLYNYFYSNERNGYFLLHDVVLTDEYSLPFFLNAKLDYCAEIGYEDFEIIIDNTINCGCGRSFNK